MSDTLTKSETQSFLGELAVLVALKSYLSM
jgi:hypothetical protein